MSSSSLRKNQPESIDPPNLNTLESQVETESPGQTSFKKRIAFAKRKVTTKDGWFGDYDYAWLCIPALPFSAKASRKQPPFYSLDADLPLALAISSGLQHALAMLAGMCPIGIMRTWNLLAHRTYIGLITPPIIFAGSLNLDSTTSAYMISASLIGCGASKITIINQLLIDGTGILSLVQISRTPLFYGYYLGTGLISGECLIAFYFIQ